MIEPPLNIAVHRRQSVTLQCSSTTGDDVSWDFARLDNSSDRRSVADNHSRWNAEYWNNTSFLRIYNVYTEDAGLFYCYEHTSRNAAFLSQLIVLGNNASYFVIIVHI